MLAESASALDLFSESFDSAGEAKLEIIQGTGMIISFVDYSQFTVGATQHALSEAPRQVANSLPTHGVLIQVDYLNNPAATERLANLVALDDVGGSRLALSDNYRLRFDCYLRLSPTVTLNANGLPPSNAGTTEQVLWGVGYNATLPMGRGYRTSRGNGMWGWLSTEGGHGSTVGADAALYKGSALVGGRNMDLINAATDVSTYFAPAFGAAATPVPNCPANQWVEADISVRAGQVTVQYKAVGRTATKFYENQPGTNPDAIAGTVMVGYEDSFSSNSFAPDDQWVIIDNMVVEDLVAPTMVVNQDTTLTTFVGTPTTGTYAITNNQAGANLTITEVSFSGANAGDFSVVTTLPLVIPPSTTSQLVIQFAPAAPNGVKSASMTIVSDDPQSPSYVLGDLKARRSVGSFFEAHYKMDETAGTALFDSSGHGSNAALQVREALVFAKPSLISPTDTGTSMGFLPAQSGTTGNYFTSSVVHTPTFSVSMWIKPVSTGGIRTLFQRDYDFATPYEKICGLQLTATSTLKFRIRNTDIFESDPGSPILDDEIWHVVLTHSDDDGFGNESALRSRLYVNGRRKVEATGGSTKGFPDYPISPVVSGMHFGSRTAAGAGYSGDIDDVQIYGAELTSEQVWQLYKSPGATANPDFEVLSASKSDAPASFIVTFPSSPDGSYTLWRSADLQTWTPIGESISGSTESATSSLADPDPPPGTQYYRVTRE